MTSFESGMSRSNSYASLIGTSRSFGPHTMSVGHPMSERPERFNADLRAFLAEQPSSERERVAAAASQQAAEPADVEAEDAA